MESYSLAVLFQASDLGVHFSHRRTRSPSKGGNKSVDTKGRGVRTHAHKTQPRAHRPPTILAPAARRACAALPKVAGNFARSPALDGSLLLDEIYDRHFLGETSHVELLNTSDLTATDKRRVERGGSGGWSKQAEGGDTWPDVLSWTVQRPEDNLRGGRWGSRTGVARAPSSARGATGCLLMGAADSSASLPPRADRWPLRPRRWMQA